MAGFCFLKSTLAEFFPKKKCKEFYLSFWLTQNEYLYKKIWTKIFAITKFDVNI